jgi:hypothetical protein
MAQRVNAPDKTTSNVLAMTQAKPTTPMRHYAINHTTDGWLTLPDDEGEAVDRITELEHFFGAPLVFLIVSDDVLEGEPTEGRWHPDRRAVLERWGHEGQATYSDSEVAIHTCEAANRDAFAAWDDAWYVVRIHRRADDLARVA